MQRLRSRKGAGYIDVLICMSILTLTAIIFGTTFPCGARAISQAGDNAKATAIAQRKIEQVRSLGYESITYTILRQEGMIDQNPTITPYSFTIADSVSAELPNGAGTLTITDDTSTIKRIVVNVSYTGPNSMVRNVVLTTLICDKRTKVGP